MCGSEAVAASAVVADSFARKFLLAEDCGPGLWFAADGSAAVTVLDIVGVRASVIDRVSLPMRLQKRLSGRFNFFRLVRLAI